MCLAGLTFCDNGTPLEDDKWCDDNADCDDFSDEENCYTCTDGKQIPDRWLCDNDQDCSDGGDEDICTKADLEKLSFF